MYEICLLIGTGCVLVLGMVIKGYISDEDFTNSIFDDYDLVFDVIMEYKFGFGDDALDGDDTDVLYALSSFKKTWQDHPDFPDMYDALQLEFNWSDGNKYDVEGDTNV